MNEFKGQDEHYLDKCTLSFNKMHGMAYIDTKSVLDTPDLRGNSEDLDLSWDEQRVVNELKNPMKWKIYEDLPLEHSDTCPSRQYIQKLKADGKDFMPGENKVKMASCCFILDRDDNLLITRRPSYLEIFPKAWVYPGGLANFNEALEINCFREVEEEVGFTFEYTDETNPKCDTFRMISPIKHGHDWYKVDFKPSYMYESVTMTLGDQPDFGETIPPISQHLVLFYQAKIDASYKDLIH